MTLPYRMLWVEVLLTKMPESTKNLADRRLSKFPVNDYPRRKSTLFSYYFRSQACYAWVEPLHSFLPLSALRSLSQAKQYI